MPFNSLASHRILIVFSSVLTMNWIYPFQFILQDFLNYHIGDCYFHELDISVWVIEVVEMYLEKFSSEFRGKFDFTYIEIAYKN